MLTHLKSLQSNQNVLQLKFTRSSIVNSESVADMGRLKSDLGPIKIPSEMAVAPRYKLFTLLKLFTLFILFTALLKMFNSVFTVYTL